MNPLRTIAERMTRSLVIKRRLPAQLNRRPFWGAADSALGYLRPSLPSEELFAIALEFVNAGDTVWDVGANVGLFTFSAADRAGESGLVVAIEADIWLANLLRRSCEFSENGDLNIAVVPSAASDSIGISKLLIAKRGRSSNALERSGHRTQAGGTRYVQYTPTVTLDSLLEVFHAPSFLKIDAEGAEQYILRGAKRILSEHRPVVYCEVGAEQNDQIVGIFHEHDYKLYDPGETERREVVACPSNTLAIPSERAGTG